jgi:hypothetical protein
VLKLLSSVLPGMIAGILSSSLALFLGASFLMAFAIYGLVASAITFVVSLAAFLSSRPVDQSNMNMVRVASQAETSHHRP